MPVIPTGQPVIAPSAKPSTIIPTITTTTAVPSYSYQPTTTPTTIPTVNIYTNMTYCPVSILSKVLLSCFCCCCNYCFCS